MGTRIRPAVVGATGYTGYELTRILLHHPRAETPLLLQRSGDGPGELATAYPQLAGNGYGSLPLEAFDWGKAQSADVLFLCTPHEISREWVPQALAQGMRVVDLSGAWRLKRAPNRAVYGFSDSDPQRAAAADAAAVYGIPELHAGKLAEAQLVANAGCYATSIILALAPWLQAGLLDLQHGVICDAKSGVSGAGKQPTTKTHFVEVADNFSAYSVFGHRHTGEMREQLGLRPQELQFTPHLLPIPRGILSTIYVRAKDGVTADQLESCLAAAYAGRPFVRIFGQARLPQIRFSLHTNYCDLGFAMEEDSRRVVLVSCLDNLLKGAAGQAVQNMNLMFGWDEAEGLR